MAATKKSVGPFGPYVAKKAPPVGPWGTFGFPSVPGFTPFAPNLTPPSGLYDPSIDAQVGASQRGLADATYDAGTQRSRLLGDYEIGKTKVGQGYDRGIEDFGTQRQYAGEDRDTAEANLKRSYGRLANSQRQAISNSGLLGGGARLQAATKRAANEELDRAPIETGYSRTISGIDTGVRRLGQDRDTQLADLALGYQRGTDDITTSLGRAGREAGQFKIDAGTLAAGQAATAGWDPNVGRPSNEFKSPGGTTYRVLKTASGNVFQLPDGRRVKTRPA